MNYKFVLFDVDDTILDFKAAENFAFKKTHNDFNIQFSESAYEVYHKINSNLWKEFEKGVVSVEDIRNTRFKQYVKETNLKCDPEILKSVYENNLALGKHMFKDNIVDTLKYIKKYAKIYTITNGIAKIQQNRLKLSGLDVLFDGCFISDLIGFRKPEKKFFEYVENSISKFDKKKTLLVGDSLTADIPASNFGYDTCWINRKNKQLPNNCVKPKYIINSFDELKNYFKE